MINPLLQKKRAESNRKVALDAVLETLDQEKTPQTDYTTQNGKMMGKGTEVEEGALNDAIPATLLASSKKSNLEPTCPVHGVVSPNGVHQCPKCREEGHYQKVTWLAHPSKTSSSKCAACESGDCFQHIPSLSGNTVNDLTNAVKPGVPETPLASDATFFKESDGDFEVTRTAAGRIIVADTKSYGAGTPNGGTPTTAPAPPAPTATPGMTATPPPASGGNPVPPVNSVNKTPQQLSQEAMTPQQNGQALTQEQLNQVLNAVKGASLNNVIARVRAAIRPHIASIGIKPSPTMLPPRDDMRSHLDEDVKDEVKAGVTDVPDTAPSAPTPQQQKPWKTRSQDALLNQALASDKKAGYADEDDEHISDVGTLYDRLEYLRGQLRDEVISLGELEELQNLAEYIEPGDVELLEAAIGSSSSSNSGTPATEPKEPFSPNDDDKKFLREMGIKAKKAVQTEEGIHDACPGCGGVNLKKFDSEAEDGSLVECNDCGCFFAV